MAGWREATKTVILVVEVTAVVLTLLLDLLIPTLVILVLASVSLLARRERPSSLGSTALLVRGAWFGRWLPFPW